MKPLKTIIALLLVVAVLASCSRGITVEEAANGKAKCNRNYLRG